MAPIDLHARARRRLGARGLGRRVRPACKWRSETDCIFRFDLKKIPKLRPQTRAAGGLPRRFRWRWRTDRSFHSQQLHRVAEVDLALVAFGKIEILDRADAFADEHRPAFGIERAVAREHDVVGAEEGDAASER